jgi:transcription elongation factor Elf1/predicted nucleic-acid-binding Zn-ribbon protein
MAIFTCPYCGTEKVMSPSKVAKNRTCGAISCQVKYETFHGHGNKGKVRSEEFKQQVSETTKGRKQTSEHIAKRVESRKENGWWSDPVETQNNISYGRITGKQIDTSGQNNGMYLDGRSLTPEGGSRITLEYKRWHTKVMENANYKCENCGSTESIIAHHKLNWREYPDFRFVPENGIVLCRQCHYIEHYSEPLAE